jgi:hypothetical protein
MQKEVVIFTGAGASAHFGLPVTERLTQLIVDGVNKLTLFADFGQEGKKMRRKLGEHLQDELPGFNPSNA